MIYKQWKSIQGLRLGSVQKERDVINAISIKHCQASLDRCKQTLYQNLQVIALFFTLKLELKNLAPKSPPHYYYFT